MWHEGEEEEPPMTGEPIGHCGDRSPREVEQQVCAVSTASALDELCAAVDAADWLLARAKTIHQLSRQIAIRWIESNGEFDIGQIHYSVGYATTTKCADTKVTGLRLLDALGGDFEAFLQALVAQPYKSTSARCHLTADDYRRLFFTRPTSRLVAGALPRVLKRINNRFRR